MIFTIWIVLVGVALALSLLAAANDTLPGDQAITEWLQEQPLPGQDLSDFVRAVTTAEVVLATGAAVTLVLWLTGYRQQAILLAVGLAALAVTQSGVKELVDRPRPGGQLVDIRAGGSSPSFPAGHVMSGAFLHGFFIYLTLTLPLPRSVATLLTTTAAFVMALAGPVNVWLGVHWPSDVLGGYLLTAILLLPLFVLDLWRRSRSSGSFLPIFTSHC